MRPNTVRVRVVSVEELQGNPRDAVRPQDFQIMVERTHVVAQQLEPTVVKFSDRAAKDGTLAVEATCDRDAPRRRFAPLLG